MHCSVGDNLFSKIRQQKYLRVFLEGQERFLLSPIYAYFLNQRVENVYQSQCKIKTH